MLSSSLRTHGRTMSGERRPITKELYDRLVDASIRQGPSMNSGTSRIRSSRPLKKQSKNARTKKALGGR